jgi:hypothetical protein
LRGLESSIKHAPATKAHASEIPVAPIFASRAERCDCPIAVVEIVNVVETSWVESAFNVVGLNVQVVSAGNPEQVKFVIAPPNPPIEPI